MTKEELINKFLSILPTDFESITHGEIKDNSTLILSNETHKFTFKCYEKRSTDTNQCKTFFYKDMETGEIHYKDKVKYKTDKKAIEAAMRINVMSKTIHKRMAYKCNECGFWHIGRNQTVLTQKMKDKIKIKHNLL